MTSPNLPPARDGVEARLDLILAELRALREVVAELRPALPSPASQATPAATPAKPSVSSRSSSTRTAARLSSKASKEAS